MNNTKRHNRSDLVDILTRMADQGNSRRFRISTIYRVSDHGNVRRPVVIGLEQAGDDIGLHSLRLDDDVLDYDAWPKDGSVPSYIGVKRILKLLGVMDVKDAARAARKAQKDAEDALSELVERGVLAEEKLIALRAAWAGVGEDLPA